MQSRITRFFEERLEGIDHPRQLGKRLRPGRDGLWRYRIGDYCAICRLEEGHLLVLVLEVGHRVKIYQSW